MCFQWHYQVVGVELLLSSLCFLLALPLKFLNLSKKLFNFLKFGIFLTPFVFVFATKLRGVEEVFSLEFLINQIAGRISVLETSMLPVHYYDTNLNLDLFYDKFSFWNQLKLIIDGIMCSTKFLILM